MSSTQQLLLGEGAGSSIPVYIEEVFSCFLYTGTGATQTITNNIDLSTKGGLTWIKGRSGATGHRLTDTARGVTKSLASNSTAAEATESTGLTAFSTTGFTIGADADYNTSAATYASWTFREQPKFFDIVTFTTDGSGNAVFSHNLGSLPGAIIFKSTSASQWPVYHRSLGGSQDIYLNLTSAAGAQAGWCTPTSTQVTVTSVLNGSETYAAYLFAHDAGGFGLLGTDNVISCGTCSAGATVNLGYEPQFVLMKQTNGTQPWEVIDSSRGFFAAPSTLTKYLVPNTTATEQSWGGPFPPTATGFVDGHGGGTYIYIAIRRGLMKTPTDATTVFSLQSIVEPISTPIFSAGTAPPDFILNYPRITGADGFFYLDRLRGNAISLTSATAAAETSPLAVVPPWFFDTGQRATIAAGAYYNNGGGYLVQYSFIRAPSFFDEVCYTGDGTTGRNISHNLGVLPELVICKSRSAATNWKVNDSTGQVLALNLSDGFSGTTLAGGYVTGANATNVQVQGYLGSVSAVNVAATTYVLYLFATCAGVSKVGSYTGNGTTQTINCGFGAGGARFVLIKRTDATGYWYVYDTARGMTVLTDPYLFINAGAAEVNTLGSVTTVSTGFALNSAVLADINISAGTFIFLAIA